MMPSDPRMRRAYDRIAHNLETANERTQETIYSFTNTYISPCLAATRDHISDGYAATTQCCCVSDDDRRRRLRERARLRGRAEFSFDFYDDLDDGEADALLGLAAAADDAGNIGGNSSSSRGQPQPRERQMNYGTRQPGSRAVLSAGHGSSLPEDGIKNIPSSSYFGFLDKLPFKIGTKRFKYRPSVADLQDQPPIRHRSIEEEEEEEPLLADSGSEDERHKQRQRRRARSNTITSRHTTDSLSSRGDIFPSEDEMDDAVPLELEYEWSLERTTTGHSSDDSRAGGQRLSAARSGSQRSIRTMSSTKSNKPSASSAIMFEQKILDTSHVSHLESKNDEQDTALQTASSDATHFQSSPPSTSPSDRLQSHHRPSPLPPAFEATVPESSSKANFRSGSNVKPNSSSSEAFSFNAAALPRF